MNELRDQSESAVLVHRHPRMVHIVLNRPRVLNSLNLEMIRFIDRALDEVEADQAVQFVLFSGAGERGFCAGFERRANCRRYLRAVYVCNFRRAFGGVRVGEIFANAKAGDGVFETEFDCGGFVRGQRICYC